MPTYFVAVRHLPLERRPSRNFGGVLVLAGFAGTLIGGRGGRSRWRARRPDGHFLLSGWPLIASLPFTLLAILHPSPAIFWPAMFVTLLLLFLNTGPLNAAMANVLPAELRGRGFAINTMAIHLLGDAPSPLLIGVVKDRDRAARAGAGDGAAAGASPGWCCWLAARRCARDLQRRPRCRA